MVELARKRERDRVREREGGRNESESEAPRKIAKQQEGKVLVDTVSRYRLAGRDKE